jgi:phosphotransacetylase
MRQMVAETAHGLSDRPRIAFWEIDDPRVRAVVSWPGKPFQPVIVGDEPVEGAGWLPAEHVRGAFAKRFPDFRRPENESDLVGAALRLRWADGAIGGARTESADVLRSALRFVGTAGTVSLAMRATAAGGRPGEDSSAAELLLTDCAVIPQPTAEQLADIAVEAVRLWRAISGVPPAVAFLWVSTHAKGDPSQDVLRIRRALNRFRSACPDVPAEGEIQADAAVSRAVALLKGLDGSPGVPANILVFPDLAAANISYKLLQHLGGYAMTAVTLGLDRPMFDVSRGARMEEIRDSAVLCATLARAVADSRLEAMQ